MKRNIKECCEMIQQCISIDEVLNEYGVRESKLRRRYFCPFHDDGKKPGASASRNLFHCFVCNRTWDVVAFVKEYEQCLTWEAIKIIDAKFHLGLLSPLTREEQKELERKRIEREKVAQRKKAQKKFENECMHKILARIRYWEGKKERFSITAKEYHRGYWYKSHPFFVAIKNLEWLEWLFCVLGGFYHPECEYDYTYGTDKRKILIMLYKQQIFIK